MAVDGHSATEIDEMADSVEDAKDPADEQNLVADDAESDVVEGPDSMAGAPEVLRREQWWRRAPRNTQAWAAAVVGVMLVALGVLAGWLEHASGLAARADHQRSEYLQVGRQGAVDLTTIDYRHVDQDVKRVLDSATGQFYEDFQKRSQPFADVVKQVQSTSQGTVTAAGIESETSEGADVLVAVTVKSTSADAPQQDLRLWRMRVSVQKVGDQAKVANVSFVP